MLSKGASMPRHEPFSDSVAKGLQANFTCPRREAIDELTF
jgi:hypothetical protein